MAYFWSSIRKRNTSCGSIESNISSTISSDISEPDEYEKLNENKSQDVSIQTITEADKIGFMKIINKNIEHRVNDLYALKNKKLTKSKSVDNLYCLANDKACQIGDHELILDKLDEMNFKSNISTVLIAFTAVVAYVNLFHIIGTFNSS